MDSRRLPQPSMRAVCSPAATRAENSAQARTAAIAALAQDTPGLSGRTLLNRLYYDRIGRLLSKAGKVDTIDARGGVPLMLGTVTGSEIRQPLGYAMVGGLIVSQALTLFTTPVIYLYLDKLSNAFSRWSRSTRAADSAADAEHGSVKEAAE